MNARAKLLAEATELEIKFKKNISSVNLMKLVAEAKGEPEPLYESVPSGPKLKAGETNEVDPDDEEEEIEVERPAAVRVVGAKAKQQRRRLMVAKARKKAFKKSIVTITNKDNRENDFMTTVYLSFENQYFGLARVVPLDIPVELEESLIRIASGTIMTLHKDEIIDGKRTGNKVPMRVKKFAISYSRKQPK